MNKTRKIIFFIVGLILFLTLSGPAFAQDTVYGTISGDIQEGVSLNIATYSCGTETLVATITTNAEGYYAVGSLENDSYGILPQHADYNFSPKTVILRVPQTNIRSYDFTATAISTQ